MNDTSINDLRRSEETKVLVSMESLFAGDRLCVDGIEPDETGTILLVEDEAFVRGVACEILRTVGYRVLAAKSAKEAAIIFEEEGRHIDLLLSDMILPGETGRELAERLRRKNPNLKVLLASGYGEQITGLSKQREPYLAKPFSSEELIRRVREAMARPH